jgi:hypothetical protein
MNERYSPNPKPPVWQSVFGVISVILLIISGIQYIGDAIRVDPTPTRSLATLQFLLQSVTETAAALVTADSTAEATETPPAPTP